MLVNYDKLIIVTTVLSYGLFTGSDEEGLNSRTHEHNILSKTINVSIYNSLTSTGVVRSKDATIAN